MSKRIQSGRSAGFTLIELMVTLSVSVILLGIAYPSFTDTIRNNRIITRNNDLIAALNIARSEAAKRGVVTTVCSTNSAQTACDDSGDWNRGWMVFTDAVGVVGNCDSCESEAGDIVLLKWPAVDNGVRVKISDAADTPARFVSFKADGSVSGEVATPATMTVAYAQCSGSHGRKITLQKAGGVRSETVSCQ